MPTRQRISLSFSWDGQQEAQVYYVIDNSVVKATAKDNLRGRGSIEIPYAAAASATHLIKWSLWFPGKTLKNVSASVSVDDDDAVELDSSDSEDDHWASEGTWP